MKNKSLMACGLSFFIAATYLHKYQNKHLKVFTVTFGYTIISIDG